MKIFELKPRGIDSRLLISHAELVKLSQKSEFTFSVIFPTKKHRNYSRYQQERPQNMRRRPTDSREIESHWRITTAQKLPFYTSESSLSDTTRDSRLVTESILRISVQERICGHEFETFSFGSITAQLICPFSLAGHEN
jgi:hypothetical protein